MSEWWLILAIILGALALCGAAFAATEGYPGFVVVGSVVAAACLAFVIWKCVTEPDSGTVVGRDYSPAHFQITCSGKPVTCYTIYIPECYGITYHDPAAPHDGSSCVSPRDYEERYPIGSHYPEGAELVGDLR